MIINNRDPHRDVGIFVRRAVISDTFPRDVSFIFHSVTNDVTAVKRLGNAEEDSCQMVKVHPQGD